MDQTVLPEEIILNLPLESMKGKPYVLPRFLNKIEKLRINRVPVDLGPGTKLFPTLKDERIKENDLIVVVDDDQVYPKKLLETYKNNVEKFPDTALTLCGWNVPPGMEHGKKKTKKGAGIKFQDPTPNVSGPMNIEILQGASSFLVRKSFFTEEVFDYSAAAKGALFADDIWFSGHLAKNKIPRKLIIGDFALYRLHSFKHMGTTGLRYSVNADNQNNNDLYKYFEAHWKNFD
ncbi:MAG: hypothetical protein RIC30_05865 [Marinoscillum sp.]